MIPTLTMRPFFTVSLGFMPHMAKAQNYLEEGFRGIDLAVERSQGC